MAEKNGEQKSKMINVKINISVKFKIIINRKLYDDDDVCQDLKVI